MATSTHRVNLRMLKNYQFEARFPDIPSAPPVKFDEPLPLGEGSAPQAVDVLSAAIGNCLAASLAFCLRKARVAFDGLEAHVTTEVTRDGKGRMRIGSIAVELAPEVRATDRAGLDRCKALFEDFCTVTASVRRGIDVGVTVREPALAEV